MFGLTTLFADVIWIWKDMGEKDICPTFFNGVC